MGEIQKGEDGWMVHWMGFYFSVLVLTKVIARLILFSFPFLALISVFVYFFIVIFLLPLEF
jgi:hypothetical protein